MMDEKLNYKADLLNGKMGSLARCADTILEEYLIIIKLLDKLQIENQELKDRSREENLHYNERIKFKGDDHYGYGKS